MTTRVVVALGGNALTAEDQDGTWEQIADNARKMATPLGRLVAAGWQLAVVHGNGPQVGALAIQQETAQTQVPAQPLHQLCAMTQGQLGSVLVRAVDAQCGAGVAVAVVTHVLINPGDPAFAAPSKPIGPFLDEQQAHQLVAQRGWSVVEDSGRGFRRVVASPLPIAIVELGAISTLLNAGHVVVAAGGGGVAVADDNSTGVDAVIDKDHTAAMLATQLGALELYLVTGVDCVLLDFGTPTQRPAHELTAEQAERHLSDGQFPPGSMGPKIAAALAFLRAGGRRAVITSPRLLASAAAGDPHAGTSISASVLVSDVGAQAS